MPRPSLQRNLPAWNAVIIAAVVVVFGGIGYNAVRQSDIDAAKGRLRTVVGRLADVSRTSLAERARRVQEAARDSVVIAGVRSPRDAAAALRRLVQLVPDTGLTVATVVQDPAGQLILQSSPNVPSLFAERPREGWISPMVAHGDSLFIEISSPIVDGQTLLGHVIEVRRIRSTSPAVRNLTALVGTDAEVQLGNRDRSVWSDLRRPIDPPPTLDTLFRYASGGKTRLAAAQPVPGTPLVVAVEFPEDQVLAPSRALLWRFIVIAALTITGGALVMWLQTRRIIEPLARLTTAAETIATGERPLPAPIPHREDEVGRLDRAFRTMADSVQEARESLEQQVAERTRALEQTRDALVRRERMAVLGQLASSVGHEIRNPLGVMRNSVFFLSMSLKDASPKVKMHLTTLENQIRITEKIVADILDFTRVVAPEAAEILVDQFIAEQVARVTPSSGIRIQTEVPNSIPSIRADPTQIGQVVLNLLTNAIQAMDGKGGIIVVRAVATGEMIRLEVEDDGPGVADEHVAQIFEPLFTTKARGFGLGLAVSRSLAQANGGWLSVRRADGGGAIFMLELPTVPAGVRQP